MENSLLNHSFSSKRRITISETQSALKKYSEGFENANNLETDLPIFLDANVLLKFYKISFHERTQVKSFLSKNKNRIYLTPQVESEFLKHRISHIKSFQSSLDETQNSFNNILKDVESLKNGTLGSFNQFVKSNKIIIEDYDSLHKDLSTLYQELSTNISSLFIDNNIIDRLKEKSEELTNIISKLRKNADIEQKDDLLELIADFKIVGHLTNDEKDKLITRFNEMKAEYDKNKSDINYKQKNSFPGCGEKKEGEQSGDFIIYHEILKFMIDEQEEKKNVIFLTDDTTKEDWLTRKDSNYCPFTHYIINDYICTNNIIYIFPSTDKLRISYETIYSDTSDLEISDNLPSEDTQKEHPAFEESDSYIKQVLDKIEQASTFHNFINIYKEPQYLKISEESFLSELRTSENWATTYGAGFVGKSYFVNKILGRKGFDIQTSYSILEKLVQEGKIGLYDYTDDGYNTVEAIKLTT